MKKNIVYCLFICFFLTVCSCKEKNPGQNENTVVINTNDIKSFDIDSVLSFEKSIQLQDTGEDVFIGEINKIIFYGENIFVLDSRKARALFIFDSDGNHAGTIHRPGNGTGEYTSINDFQIDEDAMQIIILDKNRRSLLFYDINGNFIRHLRFNFFINGFSLYQKNKIILDKGNYISDETNKAIAIADKADGKIIKHLFPQDDLLKNMTFSPKSSLNVYDDETCYMPSMNNCIYGIADDSLKLKYRIDFGHSWPDKSELERLKEKHPVEIMKKLADSGYVLFPNMMETHQLFYLTFFYNEKNIVVLEEKSTNIKKIFIWDTDNEIELPVAVYENFVVAVKYDVEKSPVLLFGIVRK
jgi:hypothetical protein